MRTDLVKVGQIVEFKHGNGVHTGTVKTVGRNGEDEMGSEVVIGDIYPHIYDSPTVTMHGGDLIVQTKPGFRAATNQTQPTRAEVERDRIARTQYVNDPRLTVEQNRERREALVA